MGFASDEAEAIVNSKAKHRVGEGLEGVVRPRCQPTVVLRFVQVKLCVAFGAADVSPTKLERCSCGGGGGEGERCVVSYLCC